MIVAYFNAIKNHMTSFKSTIGSLEGQLDNLDYAYSTVLAKSINEID